MTFFRKVLLRSGDTVPCFPKLITMEITVDALLLGMDPTYGALTENVVPLSWHVLQIGEVASVTLCVRPCRFC